MHSHILPGIDDGAKNTEESLRLIQGMVDLGYQRLIATPHIMSDLYPNTPQTIENAYLHLNKALENSTLNIPITYGAEYLIDEEFPSKIEKGLLCLHENYVLVETMFSSFPQNIEEILFTLRSHQYIPVLAHPERYLYLEKDLKQLDVFLKHGCKMQSNILSFAGYYGSREKELAKRILEADLINFLGTDMHKKSHLSTIRNLKVNHKIAKKLESISYINTEWTSTKKR